MVLDLVKNAELFAKQKHSGQIRQDGTSYSKHLENVVYQITQYLGTTEGRTNKSTYKKHR